MDATINPSTDAIRHAQLYPEKDRIRQAEVHLIVASPADLAPCGRSPVRAAQGRFFCPLQRNHERATPLCGSSVVPERRDTSVAPSPMIHRTPEKSSNFPLKYVDSRPLVKPGWRCPRRAGRRRLRKDGSLAGRVIENPRCWQRIWSPLNPAVSPGRRILPKAGPSCSPPRRAGRLFSKGKGPRGPWILAPGPSSGHPGLPAGSPAGARRIGGRT